MLYPAEVVAGLSSRENVDLGGRGGVEFWTENLARVGLRSATLADHRRGDVGEQCRLVCNDFWGLLEHLGAV